MVNFTKIKKIIGCSHAKEINVDPLLTLCTKSKSNWIKDINIRLEPTNYIKENIGRAFHDIEDILTIDQADKSKNK